MSDKVEIYRMGTTLVAHGATWSFKPGTTREDFAEEFHKNPMIAERDFAANPPQLVEQAMRAPELVDQLANRERLSPVNEAGGFHEWFVGEPEHEYYLHIDMSKSRDATGVGLCHYDHVTDKYVMDLIHNQDPGPDWELSFERVFHLIQEIHNLGFRLAKITFDTWQSYHMIEKLTNAGFVAEHYSVDRGTEAYDTLIELIMSQRLDYYYQARFIEEMKFLKLYDGKKYDHDSQHCFTGDTRVSLLSGEEVTFEELVLRYGTSGERFPVYSLDEEGNVTVGLAYAPRLSKQDAEIVEVTLDNYHVVRCTPDHRWMRKDGTYTEAKDLKPGDSLMPFYRKLSFKGNDAGYETFFNPRDAKHYKTHVMVDTWQHGALEPGQVVHHDNEEKNDNRPINLVRMTREAHVSMHTKKMHQDPVWKAKLTAGQFERNNSAEGKAKSAETAKRLHEEGKISVDAALEAKWGKRVKTSYEKRKMDLRLHKNHRVLSVKPAGRADVYDLSCDPYSNFALSAGVFVHNSKDTSDAVAGAVTNCVKARVGLTLKEKDIKGAIQESPTLPIVAETNETGEVTWFSWPDLHSMNIQDGERVRRRVFRFHAVEDSDILISLLGWHDKPHDVLMVDHYLVWQGFSNEATLEPLCDYVREACRWLNIDAISLNELVPLELVTFLQKTGRKLSSPLQARSGTMQKQKVAKTPMSTKVGFRVTVAQIRQGNIKFPNNELLIRDLYYATEDNLADRKYVAALAGWCEFMSKWAGFGPQAKQMPSSIGTTGVRPMGAQAAAIGKGIRQRGRMPTRSGDRSVDNLRARYAQGMKRFNSPSKTEEDGEESMRSLPRIKVGPGRYRR